MSSRAGNHLRSITYRLSAAPPTYLPTIVPSITGALLDCKPLLSSAPTSILNTPDGVALHKFKAQITALLNDNRSSSSRWAAVVLIKATIGLGGWEILQASGGSWVRGLLSILGKATECPSTKEICVLVLTQIFLLTQAYPNLIREITTPSLPAFVTTCLNLVGASKITVNQWNVSQLETQAHLLPTVLQSFEHLLPHHPTIFRSFLSQLHKLLSTLVAQTPSYHLSDSGVHLNRDPEIVEAAQRLFTLLPFCAPKASSSQEWATNMHRLLEEAHTNCNSIFRSVIEDWQSVAGVNSSQSTTTDTVVTQSLSSLGLASWVGIHAGCERLQGLLGIIQTFLTSPTAAPVTLPLGSLTDLLVRITSVTAPSIRSTAVASDMRINDQISKDERESLWAILPFIHVTALGVIMAACERFGTAIMPVFQTFLEQICWVFSRENYSVALRQQCYVVVAEMLQLAGVAMTKSQATSLSAIIKTCCLDVIPVVEEPSSTPTQPSAQNGTSANKIITTMNADSFLQKSTYNPSATSPPELITSALALLTTSLTCVPPQHVSKSLRAQMDRTAVLSSHLPAMLASVLNQPPNSALAKSHSSILPLLARAHPNASEVEGCLRPRMPAFVGHAKEVDDDVSESNEEEDELLHDMEVDGNNDAAIPLEVSTSEELHDEEALSSRATGENVELTLAGSEEQTLLEQKIIPEWITKTQNDGTNVITSEQSTITPDVGAQETLPTRKRGIPVPDSTTTHTKRARLESETSVTSTSPPYIAPVDVEGSSAVPQSVILPTPTNDSTNVQIVTLTAATIAEGVTTSRDSDDDDFEIPELNMDPDTDDEEDELGQL